MSPIDLVSGAGKAIKRACELNGLPFGELTVITSTVTGSVIRVGDTVAAKVLPDSIDVQALNWRLAGARKLPSAPIMQPLVAKVVSVDGYSMTLWPWRTRTRFPTWEEIGQLALKLHTTTVDADDLPAWQPLLHVGNDVRSYLEHEGSDQQVASRLTHVAEKLRREYASNSGRMRSGLIHGDLHDDQILQDPDGSNVAIDLESLSIGPLGYDLMRAHWERISRPNGWGATACEQLARGYGDDVAEWPEFDLLLRIYSTAVAAHSLATLGPRALEIPTISALGTVEPSVSGPEGILE